MEKTAMILAAGRGKRLMPLTRHLPKPLIQAGAKALIDWQIERLLKAKFFHLVINAAYLHEKLCAHFQANPPLGAHIRLSIENPALESAGGIKKALPLIQQSAQHAPFLVTNADIFTQMDFAHFWEQFSTRLKPNEAAIVLVPNPPHHLEGDFSWDSKNHLITFKHHQTYTYSGTGIFTPDFFNAVPAEKPFKLKDLFFKAIEEKRLFGLLCHQFWLDVGTLDRLNFLENFLKNHPHF